MTRKTYCPECGAKMEYTGKMPNFCMACGFALNSAAQSRNVGPAGVTGEVGHELEPNDEEQHDEERENYNYGGIEGLDVELYGADDNQGQKISDLVGTLPEDHKPTLINQSKRGRKKGKKRVQDDFKREAGSLRSPKQQGGG